MAEFLPAPALLPSPLASMAFAEQRAERVARERARKAQADKEFLQRQSERLDAERARKAWDKQARQLISLRREMKERQEPGYGPVRSAGAGQVQCYEVLYTIADAVLSHTYCCCAATQIIYARLRAIALELSSNACTRMRLRGSRGNTTC